MCKYKNIMLKKLECEVNYYPLFLTKLEAFKLYLNYIKTLLKIVI